MDLEVIGWESNSRRANEGYCGSLYLGGKIQLGLCVQNKSKYSRHEILCNMLKSTYKQIKIMLTVLTNNVIYLWLLKNAK